MRRHSAAGISRLATLLAAGGLILSGCQERPPLDVPQASAPSETSPTEPGTQQEQVEVAVKSWDETQQLIARNQGKVVVVDLWTSW